MLSFAPAKINIGLHVTEKRMDGYHEIETVFYPIKLYDVVEITPSESFAFRSHGNFIPSGGDNLCARAYHLLARDHMISPVCIDLLKNIPVGAGLGGGSADAAEVLLLLDELNGLGLCTKKLKSYATQLGADCSFFLDKKAVFAYGIGADFEDVVVDLSNYYIVVVHPDIHISTVEAYQSITPQTPVVDLRRAVQLPIQDWKYHIVNDFELGIFKRYPVIETIKHKLYEAGALYASMSGSGSAVYGIFEQAIVLEELQSLGRVYYPIDL